MAPVTRDAGWPVYELDASHNPHITVPDKTVTVVATSEGILLGSGGASGHGHDGHERDDDPDAVAVDVHELVRHHYGVPAAVRASSPRIAGMRGVLWSVLTLLEEGATHVGVATDHVIESFRNDLWPGYKTSAGMPPVTGVTSPVVLIRTPYNKGAGKSSEGRTAGLSHPHTAAHAGRRRIPGGIDHPRQLHGCHRSVGRRRDALLHRPGFAGDHRAAL